MVKVKFVVMLIMVGGILSLILTSNAVVIHNTVQNNIVESNVEVSDVSSKQTADSVLGWELGDQQEGIKVPGFSITGICTGMSDNVVVIVEDTKVDEFPQSRGNSIAADFQRRIYNPTAAVYGVPRESIDFDGSHDIAIVVVDTVAHSTSWSGVYGGQYNGYEQITVSTNLDWGTIAHEYQHCIYNHVRTGSPYHERWFNEGMAEFWPNFLKIQTSNRSSDHYMEAVEEGYKANIPLMEFAPSGSPYYSANYGMGYMFVFYLYDQYGVNFLSAVLSDNDQSIYHAINDQLDAFGYDYTFRDLFFDFQMAMRLNDLSVNPKWGYIGMPFYVMNNKNERADNLPLDLDFNVFHWAGESAKIKYSDAPDHVALKLTFDGSEDEGIFDVHAITKSYVNVSYTLNFASTMKIDSDTQQGELIVFLPSDVSDVEILVANGNGPDHGYDVANSEIFATLRDSASVQVEAFDPELTGKISSTKYNGEERIVNVEANLNWNLDKSIYDAGLYPTVILYDSDGEFPFNVRNKLTYDPESGKWTGDLSIPADIANGRYIVKLVMQGAELDTKKVGIGVSAPGFTIFVFSIAFAAFVFLRKKKELNL